MKKFPWVLLSSFFLSFPLVSASFGDTLGNLMYQMQYFLSRPEVRGVVIFFAMFMILLAVFKIALHRLPLFRNQTRQLNAVALGFSLLSVFGIFFAADRSFEEVARIVATYGGNFGAILVGSMVGLVFYYLFREQIQKGHWTLKVGMLLISIGLALMTMGILFPSSIVSIPP